MGPSVTLLLAGLLVAPAAQAQMHGSCAPGTASGTLDVSDVVARLPTTGALSFGGGGEGGYEAPAGSGTSAIYAAARWVGGWSAEK